MYRLAARMVQHLRQSLTTYHGLFSAGRCQGWELEELLFKAIQSDNQAQHHAFWREAGHDDKADITVRINGDIHFLQIKSGVMKKDRSTKQEFLELSGHRLGRFDADLAAITQYLNSGSSEIIAVPYSRVDDEQGRHHHYKIVYVNPEHMRGLNTEDWVSSGRSWRQTNRHGVVFTLHPKMSWQIWWRIPEELLADGPEIVIG